MKIEHTAYQVADPAALAKWYVDHLGLTMKRVQTAPPFGHFLADDGDAVMLEFYNHPKIAVPDYHGLDPMVLHIAFVCDDVAEVRQRLTAAGASPVGDVQVTDAGDHIAMLRDPWGLAIQFVQRAEKMI